MKLKQTGLILLVTALFSGPAAAKSVLSPWGMMNEFGPWDAEDVWRQQYLEHQPHYPTRPRRTLRQRLRFSQPVNHASVDIDAHMDKVPLFYKPAKRVRPYDIQVRVLTPEYPAMRVTGSPSRSKDAPAPRNGRLDLTCEIESIRRWDRDRMHGWDVRIAATFNDRGTVERLEKARTVLMAHGVCYSASDAPGLLLARGIYEYHMAFVSRFDDSDKAAVMMEIGTGMHFNTAGNGYFERPRVEIAFTHIDDRKRIRIRYR